MVWRCNAGDMAVISRCVARPVPGLMDTFNKYLSGGSDAATVRVATFWGGVCWKPIWIPAGATAVNVTGSASVTRLSHCRRSGSYILTLGDAFDPAPSEKRA